jgi:hypothetical protein
MAVRALAATGMPRRQADENQHFCGEQTEPVWQLDYGAYQI